MLTIDHLHAGYGKSHVLQGVSLTLQAGEILTLLGRNGSGRSTTAKAIMGLVQASGSVCWRGQELIGRKPFEIAQRGLGYVPESRDVFPGLTVRQNLLLGQKSGRPAPGWAIDDMFRIFPALKARADTPAGVLSGGEQQMLTLCRSLMGAPELLIVDEPTEGLAPALVAQVGQTMLDLKARGIAVLLMEQKLGIALDISDRCAVLGHGRVVFAGTPDNLRRDHEVRREWLEV